MRLTRENRYVKKLVLWEAQKKKKKNLRKENMQRVRVKKLLQKSKQNKENSVS